MTTALDIARSVPIEDELARRGYQLKRRGRDLVGPCPVCGGDDRFVVTPQKALWHCRQCSKGGSVIDLVLHVDKCSVRDAVETLAGKQPARREDHQAAVARAQERKRQQQELEAREKAADTTYALRIWNEGICIWKTPALSYLASRHCDGLFPIDRDAVFRFHQACPFGPGERLPCLLTLLRHIESDAPQAVHRTALTPDGRKIDRKMLGPKAGAAIKFWPDRCIRDRLTIGEGIETVLSSGLHIKHRGSLLPPAWSCTDAGNLAAFPVLHGVKHLIVLTDNDFNKTGENRAMECAERWCVAGREVELLKTKNVDEDFNDLVSKGGL